MNEGQSAKPSAQYRNSSNLAARGRLHARYSNIRWFLWLADRLALSEGAKILDVGCGPGWFWETAAAHLPGSLCLTLTDLSPGMVEEGRSRVEAVNHYSEIRALDADASALPFPDASFDAVLAMHMLYHVPDPEVAIAEMARVLRPGGKLFVTTNGESDMDAINALRAQAFGGPSIDPAVSRFGLEKAHELVSAKFGRSDLDVLHDAYLVTDPEDVHAYLVSMPPGIDASAEDLDELRRLIGAAFSEGAGILKVRREIGLVIAKSA